MTVTLREGLTHRRQRTHALSARDHIHSGAKQTAMRFVAMGGGLTCSSRRCIGHRRRWTNCAAHAGMHTQADADAGADVKHT